MHKRLEGMAAAWQVLLGEPAPLELASAHLDLHVAARLLKRAIEAWAVSPSEARGQALLSLACAMPAGLPFDLPGLLTQAAVRAHHTNMVLAWVLARASTASRNALKDLADEAWQGRIRRQVACAPPWPMMPMGPRTGAGGEAASVFTLRHGEPSGRAESALHFVLQGDGVVGHAMAAGSVAELVLLEGTPPADALHQIRSSALTQAQAQEADLDVLLLLSARGEVQLEGPQFARAVFSAGHLDAPVRFRLRAGDMAGEGAVHVDFLVKGESVYQGEMLVRVVAREQPNSHHAGPSGTLAAPDQQALAHAARTARPAPQRIMLSLSLQGGGLCLGLADLRDGDTEFADDFHAPDLGRAELEALLKGLNAALQPCYEDTAFWLAFDGTHPPNDDEGAATDKLVRTCEVIASAGALLNTWLRGSPRIAAALDYVEAHLQEDGLLSISTDKIFLPWEILYPYPWARNATVAMRQAHPLQTGAFWGARFAIETEKRGIGALAELRTRHRRMPPKASLNLNPDIAVRQLRTGQQPLDVQQAWARKLDHEGLLESVQQACGDIRNVLQDADSQATVLYVYCHGDAPQPFAGQGEHLQLDTDCALEPDDLQGGQPYVGAPIIVLNACRSGVSSPLAFSSFLAAFRLRGALGLIAASYAVPIVFGAHIGLELVRCALSPQGRLADAMLALRRRHLARHNPVPLFYALQCHLDTEART